LWQKVLGRLRAAVAPDAFATWLAPTVLLDIIGGIVVVGTPNVFVRDQIESAYLSPMTAALTEELARPVEVEIVIGSAAPV
jgi:chromosomal replication initiation ATPase DnaA